MSQIFQVRSPFPSPVCKACEREHPIGFRKSIATGNCEVYERMLQGFEEKSFFERESQRIAKYDEAAAQLLSKNLPRGLAK